MTSIKNESAGGCCRLCLNVERVMSPVQDMAWAYQVLTEEAGTPLMLKDELVCWECKAGLRRILRFKLQAFRARSILEQAHANSISNQCLSRLVTMTKTYFDAQYNSEETTFPTVPDEKWPDYKDIVPKVETEGDNYESECEVWADNSLGTSTILDDSLVKDNLRKIKKEKRKKKKARGRPAKETDSKYQLFIANESDLFSYRNRAHNSLQKYNFTCATCVIGFLSEDKLKKHNDKYHSEGVGAHVCDTCKCRFATEERLSKHLVTHSTMYRCTYGDCDFTHPLSVKVKNHYYVHAGRRPSKTKLKEPLQCDICQKEFQQRRSLNLHQEVHTSKQNYECDYCGKIKKTRLQILVHISQHRLKLMCDICGKGCKSKTALKMHALAHLDPSHRPYECAECNKRFIDKYKLLVHSRQHSGEKPFQCESCTTAYTSKEQLTQHIKKHHLVGTESMNKVVKPRTKSFFRNERIFPGQQQKRLKVKKENDGKDEGGDSKSFQCNICGKNLSTYQNLQSHFGVHSNERRIKCDECDKTFKYKPQLYAHKQRHRGDKPHQCNICGTRFGFKNILNAHLKTHSNERAFKCDECDLTFKYNSGLWTHKLIHKGEKPHQCTICGARFTLKGNLTGHMKTHTNDKPFECNVCGRKFPWRRNLRNHYKTHAKEQRVLDNLIT